MDNYTCDVCKRPLPDDYTQPTCPPTEMQLFCGVVNLCPGCRAAESKFNGPNELLKLWKRKAGVKNRPNPSQNFTISPQYPAGYTKLSNEEKREKKEIYEQLLEYRRVHGMGCYKALAKTAGLNEDLIRDIVETKRVPMETWRRVGRALQTINNSCETADPVMT